jgi:hypothetical protein
MPIQTRSAAPAAAPLFQLTDLIFDGRDIISKINQAIRSLECLNGHSPDFAPNQSFQHS